MTEPNNTSDYQGTSSHVEETKELPTAAEIDKLDYVDSQECQRLRRTMVDDGVPVKRIHSPADLQSFMDSSALDRILQVLLNICNRIARFGIFQTDAQVHYLRNSLHQVRFLFLIFFFSFSSSRDLCSVLYSESPRQRPHQHPPETRSMDIRHSHRPYPAKVRQ